MQGGDIMKIEIKIDKKCSDINVIVMTDEITEEVNEIIRKLSNSQPQMIIGFNDDNADIIDPDRIKRIYSSNQKVFIQTEKDEYVTRSRLYELEERLNKKEFIRISNSEIINLKNVKGFDLSYTGTICVQFIDATSTFVSRRYVSKIKTILGL